MANNDLIDHGVKGINPKGRLRPTHRYYIGTFGHVLVAPEVEQHIISKNVLRRLGVTTASDGETDCTTLIYKGNVLNVSTYPDGLDYFTVPQALHLIRLMSQVHRADPSWKAYPASVGGSMQWAATGSSSKPYYVSTEQRPRIELFRQLHYMYCHPSDTSFKAALSHGSILGTSLVPADVDLARLVLGPCPQCLAGKSVNPSYLSSPTMPAGRVGSRVFMDLVPLAGTTIGGNNHVLLWLDAYSGYLGVCGVDSKKSQSLMGALDIVVSAFQENIYGIDEVVTDSEACFVAIRPHLQGLLRTRHRLTPPKQHNQRIERYVRTINDRMRSVLSGLTYVLPPKLYGELMATVVFFMNMFPNKVHPTLTPAIVFNGDKMDCRQVNHAPFGSAVMVTETDKSSVSSKYEPRAELALVLGPSIMVRSAVHVYVQSTKVIKTRNRYVIIPMVPGDFGFEPKAGTVLSSLPDFINYDPSERSPPSLTDYDREMPAHAGVRADEAMRASEKKALQDQELLQTSRREGAAG